MRKEGKKYNLPSHIMTLRNIVSDADKLEALGVPGIIRMIHYHHHKHPKASIDDHAKHIIDHCEEKLYRLISERYIRTRKGRQLAGKLLNDMKKITNDRNKINKFIKRHLK